MSNTAKVQQIQRAFQGQAVEPDILESVLAICGGDVQAAISFLQAGQDDFVESANQSGPTLPKGYMDKPLGFSFRTLDRFKQKQANHPAIHLKQLFLQENSSLEVHLDEINKNYNCYYSVFLILVSQGVTLSSNCKSRILAASLAAKKEDISNFLLLTKDSICTLPEVLRALKTLDAPRRVKAIEKKIARLEKQGTAKKRTMGKMRNKLNDAKQDLFDGQTTSVSGAICKKVRKWVTLISKSQLEFFAMQMPKEPWKELGDIIHCKPTDFALDWFLPFVFGSPAPTNSIVNQCAIIDESNINMLLANHHIPYSYLRTKYAGKLTVEQKVAIAKYETLECLIWYYEELGGSDKVDIVISSRLKAAEEPKLSYGKLMERCLTFQGLGSKFFNQLLPIAERRLHEISLPLEPPVVVFGDASYSMAVAVKTSTIIASLLTALSTADLRFFNMRSFPPKTVPKTVDEVLKLASTTKCDDLTAPAVGLWEYYNKRKIVKSFIMVSDEIENESYNGWFFAQLFYKYYTEVYPAKLVFVSFLDNPTQKGRMVQAIESLGITPLQFRLDAKRPDLTKLDTLLGLLSAQSSHFVRQVKHLDSLITSGSSITELLAAVNKIPDSKEEEAEEEAKSPLQLGDSITEEKDVCGICMDRKQNTALRECGHLVCDVCAVALSTCPFCRQDVVGTLKIFAV